MVTNENTGPEFKEDNVNFMHWKHAFLKFCSAIETIIEYLTFTDYKNVSYMHWFMAHPPHTKWMWGKARFDENVGWSHVYWNLWKGIVRSVQQNERQSYETIIAYAEDRPMHWIWYKTLASIITPILR